MADKFSHHAQWAHKVIEWVALVVFLVSLTYCIGKI